MKGKLLTLQSVIIMVAILGFCQIGTASMSLSDPPWEAPGGYVSLSSGTAPTHAGGFTWNFSSFDPTAYEALYYATGDYDYNQGPPEVWTFNPSGPALGTTINGMSRLQYSPIASDLNGGKVVWTGLIDIYNDISSSSQSYDARFTLSVSDGDANPVSLMDASTLTGMDPGVGGTYQVQGDFTVNWFFELSTTGSANWSAASFIYDSLNTDPSDSLQSSVGGGFYYTPAPLSSLIFPIKSKDGKVTIINLK